MNPLPCTTLLRGWHDTSPIVPPARRKRRKGFSEGVFSCRAALKVLPTATLREAKPSPCAPPTRTRLSQLQSSPCPPGKAGEQHCCCGYTRSQPTAAGGVIEAPASLRNSLQSGCKATLPALKSGKRVSSLLGSRRRLGCWRLQKIIIIKKNLAFSGFPREHGSSLPPGCLQG